MKDKLSEKEIAVMVFALAVLIVIGIAPVVEVIVKDKYDNVLLHSVHRMILSSQSLVPLVPEEAEKVEINVYQQGKKMYYICQEDIPDTVQEIKEMCAYIGTDTP